MTLTNLMDLQPEAQWRFDRAAGSAACGWRVAIPYAATLQGGSRQHPSLITTSASSLVTAVPTFDAPDSDKNLPLGPTEHP